MNPKRARDLGFYVLLIVILIAVVYTMSGTTEAKQIKTYSDLVDLFPDARYCFDGVHPQAAGARMMAEAIIDSVKW